jgi:hypothetical protein
MLTKVIIKTLYFCYFFGRQSLGLDQDPNSIYPDPKQLKFFLNWFLLFRLAKIIFCTYFNSFLPCTFAGILNPTERCGSFLICLLTRMEELVPSGIQRKCTI